MNSPSLDDFNKYISIVQSKANNLPSGMVLGVAKALLLLLILISFSSLVARIIEFEFLQVPNEPLHRYKQSQTRSTKKNLTDFEPSLQSNLFQVELGSLNQKKIKQEVQPQGNLKQILGNLSLKGFFSGFAIILDKKTKKEEVYALGDLIADSSAQLASIESSGNYVEISLGEETAKLVLVESLTYNAQSSASNVKKGPKEIGGKSNTTVSAEGNDFYLRSEDLDKELNNFSQLLNQARVVPVFKDKKPMGYKIKAIDKGSLYEKLGLKNNDVIKKINGQEIDSPERAMSLFKILRSEKEIVLNYERNGAPSTLNYHIQ
ncbi:MAG: type II secretion system protein N [SAR324 cluster bacterium]|nr:type II secretion system protein N [SAR324 cluster bacterium]